MTAPAIVTTTGTTSLEQQLSTFRASIPVNQSGLPGIFVVPGNGVVGDGSTDDGPALSTLANTTMSGGGTIYFTPGKTYRIATPISLPLGVTLWTPDGALLEPDAVQVSISGTPLAGLWQIFNCVNGGTVVFSTVNTEAGVARVLRAPEIYPEWWGATADGGHDDTAALNACIAATTGLPLTPVTTRRYAGPKVRLAAGVYRVTDSVQATDVAGLCIEGSGRDNTTIKIDDNWSGTSHAVTVATTNTVSCAGSPFPVHQFNSGRWAAYIYSGTGAGQWAIVSDNTANQITTTTNWTITPDTSSAFYVMLVAGLDLDGVLAFTGSDFTVTATNAQMRHGIKYYRDSTFSAGGSTQGHFANVKVNLGYLDSGWQLGARDTPTQTNWQADLCSLVMCQAIGSSNTALMLRGFSCGDGSFDNALNFTFLACDSVANGYGVFVAATNVKWTGGTIQSSFLADIGINSGVQGDASFSGFRSEGSRMLLDSVSPQSVAWNIKVSDVAFTMDGFKGNRLVSWNCGGGTLTLDGVRTGTPNTITGTASSGSATTLVDSTKTFDTATYTYADGRSAVGLAGSDLRIIAGTGNGQRTQITSNTATQLTFPALAVALDGTSQYQIMPRTPVVIESSAVHVDMDGCLFTATPLEQFVQTGPAGGSWDAELHGCAELDANVTTILGSTAPYAGSLYFASGTRPASIGFGAAGTIPDTRITRVGVGQVGIPGLVASSLHVKAIGTTPTGAATTSAGGTTQYNYRLVATDGQSPPNKALASATFSVTTGPATLSPTAFVRIALASGSESAAAAYDVLKDDGTGTFKALALGVPWYLFQGDYIDYGQPMLAYTLPVADATGTLAHTGAKLGVFGATPVAQPTVTGSRSANAALASLLTQLASLGILIDGSSA